MKSLLSSSKCILLITAILFGTICASAQDRNTEIQGFFQTYRDFSFKTGAGIDIPDTALYGGGFTVAQNFAPWFAMWSQTTFFGSAEQTGLKVRMINNLEGIRYQTKMHGPFRAYAKAGMGFSRFSLDIPEGNLGSETKFSFSYGAGAQIWMSDHFGLVLDASHLIMGMPQLSDASNRDKWDSGLALTTSFAVRF